MIFDLVRDFGDLLAAMPAEHPRRRILALLDEAVRRDVHFIDRHPTTLFQCLWNTCWWYDCRQAARFIEFHQQGGDWALSVANATDAGLSRLLEHWRNRKQQTSPGFIWVRGLLPPPVRLGTSQCAILSRHESYVLSIAFSPDGQVVASCGHDGAVRVSDSITGAPLATIRAEADQPRFLRFAPDGQHLAVLFGEWTGKSLEIWNWKTGTRTASAPATEYSYDGPSFSADGTRLLYTTTDGKTHLWTIGEADPRSFWDEEREIESMFDPARRLPQPTAAALSPDGARIATAYDDGTITLWDVVSGEPASVINTHHEGGVNAVSFAPDGRSLRTIRQPNMALNTTITTFATRDAHTGELLSKCEFDDPDIMAIVASPDGQFLARCGMASNAITLLETSAEGRVHTLPGYEQPPTALAFSADGLRIASGAYDGTVCVWDRRDTAAGPPVVRKPGLKSVTIARWSPQGGLLAVGHNSGAVSLWDLEAGTCRHTLSGHHRDIYALAFSPDGRRLASGSSADPFWARMEPADTSEGPFGPPARIQPAEEPVRLWDLETGAELARCHGFEMPVHVLAFSPDGMRIAAADNMLPIARVFDSVSGTEVLTLAVDRPAHVTSVAWSPDRRWLALGTMGEEPILLCDAATGARARTFTSPGGAAMVTALAFSTDGARLVASLLVDGEATFRLRSWDMRSGECREIGSGLIDIQPLTQPERFPVQCLQRQLETEVVMAATGVRAGVLPRSAAYPTMHPDGITWAVPSVHLHVFRVEGVAPLAPTA